MYLVYPANPAWGVLTVNADDFSFSNPGYPQGTVFIDDEREEIVAFFPEGQIIGFVEK